MSANNQADQRLRDAIIAELSTPQPQFNMLRRYIDELEGVNRRELCGLDETYAPLQLPTMIFPHGSDVYWSMSTLESARITLYRYAVVYRSRKMMAITLTHSRPPENSGWTSNLFAKIKAVRNWPESEERGQESRVYNSAINLISEHAPGISKTEMLLLKTSFTWL